MLTKKVYHKKPAHSSHSQPVPRIEEERGTGGRGTAPLEAIIVDKNVFASMKRPQAEAIKWFAKLVSEADRRLPRQGTSPEVVGEDGS